MSGDADSGCRASSAAGHSCRRGHSLSVKTRHRALVSGGPQVPTGTLTVCQDTPSGTRQRRATGADGDTHKLPRHAIGHSSAADDRCRRAHSRSVKTRHRALVSGGPQERTGTLTCYEGRPGNSLVTFCLWEKNHDCNSYTDFVASFALFICCSLA